MTPPSPVPRRSTLDVSGLPEVTFGAKDTNWWGTVLFMVIEGATLGVCAASYLYLRRNFSSWPPPPVRLPSLGIPTLNLFVILLSIVPMAVVGRAGHRRDLGTIRVWLLVKTGLALAALALRWFELRALNVRWDANAYGSAAWLVVFAHATLLFVDTFEMGTLAGLSYSRSWEDKHYSDVCDAALYQYFLALVWVPLYFLVFWSPRWL
jgi:cytochrome c oxidase subunit 3